MKKSTRIILYVVSVFPLFGLIIGIVNYKKDMKFARNCLGIAIVAVIVYQVLKFYR